jgi:hypothetical protein
MSDRRGTTGAAGESMSESTTELAPEPTRRGAPARRTLLAAAWSVPAVGLTVASPARAASPVHAVEVVVPEPRERPTGADLGDVSLRLTVDGTPLQAEVLALVAGVGPTFEDGATVRTLRTDAAGVARCTGLGAGPTPGSFAVVGRHVPSGAEGRAVFTVVARPVTRPFVVRNETSGDHLGIDDTGAVAARGGLDAAVAGAAAYRFPFGAESVADGTGPIATDAGRCLTGRWDLSWLPPTVTTEVPDGSANQSWHIRADGRIEATFPGAEGLLLTDAGDGTLTLDATTDVVRFVPVG